MKKNNHHDAEVIALLDTCCPGCLAKEALARWGNRQFCEDIAMRLELAIDTGHAPAERDRLQITLAILGGAPMYKVPDTQKSLERLTGQTEYETALPNKDDDEPELVN